MKRMNPRTLWDEVQAFWQEYFPPLGNADVLVPGNVAMFLVGQYPLSYPAWYDMLSALVQKIYSTSQTAGWRIAIYWSIDVRTRVWQCVLSIEMIHHPFLWLILDQREVLFLEAESGKIIEETFDSLIKSELAVHSLKQLKSKNLREVSPSLQTNTHNDC